ncbi:hypothetical protein [Enterococcus sp. DIV0170]|uniref:hypothetical protein n=1 Tax=Enterococcus sp. DIV0170 TaxID=2774642 RepID=UPI003F2562A1
MKDETCPVCNSKEMKTGKLTGVASVQSLNARTGLGGSELQLTFCANCGEVVRLNVLNPEEIDSL